jgi:putative toxin-antitoxin system antitoxin component (TIGR02293 family)
VQLDRVLDPTTTPSRLDPLAGRSGESQDCGRIPSRDVEFSMTKAATTESPFEIGHLRVRGRSFADLRASFDAIVLTLLLDVALRKAVKAQPKTNLESLWDETARRFGHGHNATPAHRTMAPLEIHDQLVKGLPGEALFVSAAMAFDSMAEALALFDISAKTAKQRIGERLSSSESEIALRIGRVWAMAADVFASLDAARNYLRTPNFALGGAVPRDLLKTAEGEQVVISELQTQAEGGPV